MPEWNAVVWQPNVPGQLLPGRIRMLDQTRLPGSVTYIETNQAEDIAAAIRRLSIRGAPALGIAAAYGVLCAVQAVPDTAPSPEIVAAARQVGRVLTLTRPTAVNLGWAVERMNRIARQYAWLPPADLKQRLAAEATAIEAEDRAMCRAIGEHGLELLQEGATVITHCNAGALAASAWGTALAPLYVAREQGWRVQVFVDETRPLLQGARLTAWELARAGIPVTVMCDGMAAALMSRRTIHAVLVGADRIAANGDTANKIGTYGLALAARAHGIPFYVCAPSSTFDPALASGSCIPIEERNPEEVVGSFMTQTVPEGVPVWNPAFDVTPVEYITALVCEYGVLRAPNRERLADWMKR